LYCGKNLECQLYTNWQIQFAKLYYNQTLFYSYREVVAVGACVACITGQSNHKTVWCINTTFTRLYSKLFHWLSGIKVTAVSLKLATIGKCLEIRVVVISEV